VRGGNTYPKARSCPNGWQYTDIKMSCLAIVVCVLTHTSINMKWPELLILVSPEYMLHIPVDYYLSVHNSGEIYLQHPHWYYIYTYIHTIYLFFWIAVYLWRRYMKFFFIHMKAIRLGPPRLPPSCE
jgi:hypothetical protein